MAPRVSPTERIRAEIHALFDSDVELGTVLEQVARLSVRLTFQSVLEEIGPTSSAVIATSAEGTTAPRATATATSRLARSRPPWGPSSCNGPSCGAAHSALADQLFGAGVARALAGILRTYLPDAEYNVHLFSGEFALELWSGEAHDRRAHDGADSFVVPDGRIVAQTIHYSVKVDA